MTRMDVLKKLDQGASDYAAKATFSRVAGLVKSAVANALVAVHNGSTEMRFYAAGQLDATMAAVTAIAPKAEADALYIVLSSCSNLLDANADIGSSGASVALIQLEMLMAA